MNNLDVSSEILITYDDENIFKKYFRSLKKYNMLAYKEVCFKILPSLRLGELPGVNYKDNIYKCELSSDKLFSFVYGKVYLIYRVEDKKIVLMHIEPTSFFMEGHVKELDSYKGVPISDPKARFKVDLYLHMNK